LVDIIIPVFGRPDMLRKCLTSLRETVGDLSYSLYIIDDHSPEETRAELDDIYKNEVPDGTKVIRNRENYGFPISVNRAGSYGKSPYIILLNSDIVLQPGCLQTLVETAQYPKVGIVGARLVFTPDSQGAANNRKFADEDGVIQHAGIAFSVTNGPIHVHIGWPGRHPKVMQPKEVQAVTGALLLISRHVWDDITRHHAPGDPSNGPFNHVYGQGTYEDIEVCIAAKALGYKVMYQPKALAWHEANASVTGHRDKIAGGGYPVQRNASIFFARCGHLIRADEYHMW
jgi:GT2 family glycosyltransferase